MSWITRHTAAPRHLMRETALGSEVPIWLCPPLGASVRVGKVSSNSRLPAHYATNCAHTLAIAIPAGRTRALFVGGLAGQALRRLEIDGDRITTQEVIFDQFGRVRDVVQGPDGYLYLALQHATGAGTSYGLVAPSPGLVVWMVPAR